LCRREIEGTFAICSIPMKFKLSRVAGFIFILILFEGCSFTASYYTPRKDCVDCVLPSKDSTSKYLFEDFYFKNKEGKSLHAYFFKPPLGKPVAATIVYFHGNSGNIEVLYTLMRPLIDEGFQILMFDYSGYGKSEGEFSREQVFNDGVVALEYAHSRPDVQGTKVVLYGQSLGGHLAASVAGKRPDLIDALVDEGGFSSHGDIAAYYTRIKTHNTMGWSAHLLVREVYNAKHLIKKFHKPVLIIHSTEDVVVPFYMGKRIYKKANSPKEFYEIKGRHVRGPLLYKKEIADKIKNMLTLQK